MLILWSYTVVSQQLILLYTIPPCKIMCEKQLSDWASFLLFSYYVNNFQGNLAYFEAWLLKLTVHRITLTFPLTMTRT